MKTQDEEYELELNRTLVEIEKLGFKKMNLNEKEAAQIVGVSSSTMANWRKNGIGPTHKKIQNGEKARVLYPRIELAKFQINDLILCA